MTEPTEPAAEGSRRARLAAGIARFVFAARLGRSPDIARLRRVFGRTGIPTPRGISFTPGTVGGIRGEWARASVRAPVGRLLYLHGGGFVACSARTYRPLTGALAQRGFEVFVPDYRLAPEHPFPAAHDDAWAAWRGLVASEPAVLAGDSAGGHLALGVMLRARDTAGPAPRAAALFSPFLDLALTGASITANAARDGLLGEALLHRMARTYLGAVATDAPLASPLTRDLSGLPPLLVHVGEREVLRDDALRLAAAARAAGVKVTSRIFPAVPHTWQIAAALVPEARSSVDEAGAFLKRQLICDPGPRS